MEVATILERERSYITMTKLKVETIINARTEHVWAILTDFAEYGTWNHFTPQVNCTGHVGDPVTLLAQLGGGNPRSVNLTLNQWEPPHRICWGSTDWYLRVNRCQMLQLLPDGRTRYINEESFEGLLAPLVIWSQRKALMRGYRRVADGLKGEAER
jgi:hypothetical protein